MMSGKTMPAVRILLILIAVYGCLCVFIFFTQRRLLYHPGLERPSDADVVRAGLAFWPGPGDSCLGFINPSSGSDRPGVVIVFHGNAGTARERDYYHMILGGLGYRVLLAEYPGYGGRKGELNEKSLVADAKRTIRACRRELGGPVFLIGESLGCGIAAGAVSDPSVQAEGILLITPWDSLPSLAQKTYWFLPARWLAADRYDNIRNLVNYPGRVAVAIAEQDEIIPEQLGLNLYAALRNEKRLWILRDAGHNTWIERTGTAWWREVMQFLEETGSARRASGEEPGSRAVNGQPFEKGRPDAIR